MAPDNLNRRGFLGQAGMLVIAGSIAGKTLPVAGQSGRKPNPFAYDLSKVSRTDPTLVLYEETARFACPHPEPRRLTIGPDERLYIAAGKQVSVLDKAGQLVRSIGLDQPAGCVAVDEQGLIYVGAQDPIQVFNQVGEQQQRWDSPSRKSWFTALAVGVEDVFAADAAQRAVVRMDKSGKVLHRIGVKDTARSIPGLIVPSPYLDVELAPDGLLRVNNPGRHRVETYTREGHLELSWGSAGGGIQGFTGCCNPISVALLPGGKFVTCEKGLPRVKLYGPTGEFEGVVAGVESFRENMRAGSARRASDGMMGGLDAAADNQGRVYILDLVMNHVRVMSRKG
jgi:hypothetical protein